MHWKNEDSTFDPYPNRRVSKTFVSWWRPNESWPVILGPRFCSGRPFLGMPLSIGCTRSIVPALEMHWGTSVFFNTTGPIRSYDRECDCVFLVHEGIDKGTQQMNRPRLHGLDLERSSTSYRPATLGSYYCWRWRLRFSISLSLSLSLSSPWPNGLMNLRGTSISLTLTLFTLAEWTHELGRNIKLFILFPVRFVFGIRNLPTTMDGTARLWDILSKED